MYAYDLHDNTIEPGYAWLTSRGNRIVAPMSLGALSGVSMWSSFENLDIHAGFHIRLQLRGRACVGKYGTELHAQTPHPGSTVVDLPVFAKRAVWFDAMADACSWIDIWQLAPGFNGHLVFSFFLDQRGNSV